MQWQNRFPGRWVLARGLAVAALYLALGLLGQYIAVQQVTPVWLPSGVALAALLLGGRRLWPAIWIGSFLVNTSYAAGASPVAGLVTAAVAASGAAVAALAGATLLERHGDGRRCLTTARGVVAFVLVGALAPSAFAASVGTTALVGGGLVPAAGWGSTWITWWLGDTVGVLVAGSFVLAWSEPERRRSGIDAAVIGVFSTALAWLAFFRGVPVEYMLLPLLLWSALRFGSRGAATLSALVGGIAVAGTVAGGGPYAGAPRVESLLLLQAFVGVVATTGLLVAAVAAERRRRTEQLAVARHDADAARETAERASHAKDVLLANMSHELRTPVNHIVGYAGLVREQAEDAGLPDIARDAGRIGVAGERLAGVLGAVLDYSQLEAGDARLDIAPVAIARLLHELAEHMAPLALRNRNTVRVDASAAPETLRTDGAKLRAALVQLADNACKFTHDGEIRLSASTEHAGGREWVRFAVADTGPGIDAGQLARIFEPFAQVDSGPAREFGGNGLGLAIAERLCHLLGGELGVESTPGKGSTFTLRLPA